MSRGMFTDDYGDFDSSGFFIFSAITTIALVVLMFSGVGAYRFLRTPRLAPKPSIYQQVVDSCIAKGGVPIIGESKIEGYSPKEYVKECSMVKQ